MEEGCPTSLWTPPLVVYKFAERNSLTSSPCLATPCFWHKIANVNRNVNRYALRLMRNLHIFALKYAIM